MSGEIAEPLECRPWQPEDGPAPTVWSWPAGDRPALWVWSRGDWRYAAVQARHTYPDGSVIYQVAIDCDGSTSVVSRSYPWPQPGLRPARTSKSEPSSSGPPTLTRGRGPAVDAAS
ncbi:hypothetical protein AB0O57_29170 [Streptomyces sp. NPDC091201]|uniref:hypothetical protein n=1 Tax=Streptomyces sp. NPDC091201 TaxID=3155190 RepID=UPI0034149784